MFSIKFLIYLLEILIYDILYDFANIKSANKFNHIIVSPICSNYTFARYLEVAI